MRNSQKGSIVPVLLVIIALFVIGGGVYIYENKKAETPTPVSTEAQTQNSVEQTNAQNTPVTTTQQNSVNNSSNSSTNNSAQTSKNPIISLVSSASAPIGSTIIVKGSNLDPLGGHQGIGWLTHSHIFVNIKNSVGQTAILWEGGSQGGPAPISNRISATLSQSLCVISEEAAGGCPSYQYLAITPGQYYLSVSVDGRGASNVIPITVIASPVAKPVISSITSSNNVKGQFRPGDEVVMNGFNFPVTGKQLPIVWIGSTKVTNVSGLMSATNQQIKFTAPALAPGSYNLYVTGTVRVQTADLASVDYTVQSNAVSVKVLARLAIHSISSPASVGNTISISGTGFTWPSSSPNSSLAHVYIQTSTMSGPESSGLLWAGYPTSDNSITFILPSSFCTLGGDPGVPCTRQTSLTAGTYKVTVSANNLTSSPIDFKIQKNERSF